MAKKSLASLMNGIMGEAEDARQEDIHSVAESKSMVTDAPESVTDNPSSTAEAKPKGKPGRPRKPQEKSDEVRATFIIDPDTLRKVKYISLIEDCLLKDVIADALNGYIDKWEAANGRIRLPKKH